MSKRILFVVAAVALAACALYSRASNAHTARTQGDAVVQADLVGADTTTQLTNLKTFVNTHMGASVSLTLKASYDRAIAAAQAAAAPSNTNSQIYAAAQAACSGKSDSITQARCNTAYLAQHLASVPPPKIVPAPVLSKYQYSFTAPAWTPDLAGALFLGAAAALVMGLLAGRRKVLR